MKLQMFITDELNAKLKFIEEHDKRTRKMVVELLIEEKYKQLQQEKKCIKESRGK